MFYTKFLDAKEIKSRQEKYGFPSAHLIELLIYDYEVFRHILEISDRFYLKGGAAAQLYMDIPNQRASRDIDLVTDHTPEEVEKIFSEELCKKFPCKKHTPKKETRNISMSTYIVSAPSLVEEGHTVEIKVDVVFEDMKNYKLSKASPKEIFALNTEVELPAVSRGSLIGDKLLTLAKESIGLPTEKLAEYPKQLYDLARMVRDMSREDVDDMVYSFERIIKTELEIRELEHTTENIISHIFEVLDEFVKLDQAVCLFKDPLKDFQSAYVSRDARKTRSKWILDALILIQLLELIREILIEKIPPDKAHAKWANLLKELSKIEKMPAPEKAALRTEYSDQLRERMHPRCRQLRGASEERLYLELKTLDDKDLISLTDKIAIGYIEKIETFEKIKTVIPEDKEKLKAVMIKNIKEKLQFEELVQEMQKTFTYLEKYKIVRLARTEPAKIRALATLRNLHSKGETLCYVNPSNNYSQCENCKQLIDGRVFKIKTLQDNVYANYTKGPPSPSVPLHPHCDHQIRGLSEEEKTKLPEDITAVGHPIRF